MFYFVQTVTERKMRQLEEQLADTSARVSINVTIMYSITCLLLTPWDPIILS